MNPYAGLVSRSAAYLLDVLIVAVTTGAAAITFALTASVLGAEGRQLARVVLTSSVVFLPAIMAVYCALFWMLAGRTPGMAVFGLRVVDRFGRPPRWYAALVRGLLTAYLPVLALWLLVDRRHQGLHDKLARTSVLRSPRGDEVTVTTRIASSMRADHGSRGRVPAVGSGWGGVSTGPGRDAEHRRGRPDQT
ncbi:RDD family protein [Actinoplanes utahensis]|uniref:RDD family protein n=1 Tax=Actinoplanes utahensis TaxID=1869 RepID=UPI0007C68BC0|nr:RDD family protein [Actinoplanes utahensis]GIF30216.1 hypothetical protein Aut01nite_32020 [Actinoplanes utahensis]